MTRVVYADILFVINVYVTYFLLKLTDLLCRERAKRARRVAASLCGGVYSFVIFIPSIPNYALALTRLAFAALLVFVTYGKLSRKRFFTLYGGFFLVNFVFAGLMFALWYFIAPKSMMYFGSVVYFDINTLALVIMTVVCYAVMTLAEKLIRTRTPADTLFELTVFMGENSVSCNAFLDTGNSVFEPFSSFPVIIAQSGIFEKLLLPFDEADGDAFLAAGCRYIPCSSLGADGVLKGFRPDKVRIRGTKTDIETDEVYIALTDRAIRNGDYGAIINPAIIDSRASIS